MTYHKFDKKYDELIEQGRKGNTLLEATEKNVGGRKKERSLPLSNALRITRPQSAFLSITSELRLIIIRRSVIFG